MRSDHAVAEEQARAVQNREKILFERRHRAQLQDYVETRLARAEERARWEIIHAEQLATSVTAQGQPQVRAADFFLPQGVAATATSVAGAWVPSAGRETTISRQTPPVRAVDRAKHIVSKVPERTRKIIDGNDELVKSNLSRGLPKGLAVFMALLMLHIPSIALASLVMGFILIRGHHTRSGILCLGLAAILGMAIYLAVPW